MHSKGCYEFILTGNVLKKIPSLLSSPSRAFLRAAAIRNEPCQVAPHMTEQSRTGKEEMELTVVFSFNSSEALNSVLNLLESQHKTTN